MSQDKQMCFRIDEKLLKEAQHKAKSQFGIPLSALIKLFLRAFITQKGIGFYVGDEDLRKKFTSWILKTDLQRSRKGCFPLPGPNIKDIFEI